ncbi:ATP-binding protein [Acidobacteria bacterium AB60]|nr:ATP-binding protein [Acidobacteria bacterium AB60]
MMPAREIASNAVWLELERVLERVRQHASMPSGLELAEHLSHSQGLSEFKPAYSSTANYGEPNFSGERGDLISRLKTIFNLSSFEFDTLLLCAGFALDPRFQASIKAGFTENEAQAPNFGLALTVLDDPHWSALSGLGPLRYWQLVEVGPGGLLQAPLNIHERVLQHLLGVDALDDRLGPFVRSLKDEEIFDVPQELVLATTSHWRSRARTPLLLCGPDSDRRTAVFCAACAESGLRALSFDAAELPASATERESLARAITRESVLCPTATLIQTARLEHAGALESWVSRIDAPVAVDIQDGTAGERIMGMRLEVPSRTPSQRRALWATHLGSINARLDEDLDQLVDTFNLSPREVRDTAAVLEHQMCLRTGDDDFVRDLWRVCRMTARRSMDDLAARIESSASWDDLVLPTPQIEVLRQLAANARQTSIVLGDWGFSARYARGLGLSALFSGTSGTGKTMAAGVLARELDRDLYQVDLATISSKYIGETEKHLRRIFDTAERSGAILLFDEADALFGKRSQVRDSHDRYANLEISYLLQRMESYRGIAILTTNMQSALDAAFQRRLRFVVQFPFPDANSRERIWQRVFPPAAPVADLDFNRLAQLSISGGVIRNIALLAAFLAADEGSPIAMRHIASAARTEYAKLDKPLSSAETRGWE